MFWQFIINGLITGVLYSLLAIGFALIYITLIFHNCCGGHLCLHSVYDLAFLLLLSIFL